MSERDRVMIFREGRTICAGQCDGCDTQDRCSGCGLTRTYCQAESELQRRRCCGDCSHA